KSFEYLFGYEESYGCLIGTHARDKDAIVAVMALCEAAAYYMVKNMTLCDQMENLYQKYGYYKEDLISATLKGSEGANRIESIMTSLRSNPPEHFGGLKVIAIRDYKSGIRTDLTINEETSTGLPNSNVLYYELENSAWCCVRPSGTEPKVKIYLGVKGDSLSKADDSLKNLREALVNILK
ncbi:MAG: phospho-sugar mutase, partial [Youngiibacter sp.]|nr:phospho-sugar mutase [Youngiibacter sp.]